VVLVVKEVGGTMMAGGCGAKWKEGGWGWRKERRRARKIEKEREREKERKRGGYHCALK